MSRAAYHDWNSNLISVNKRIGESIVEICRKYVSTKLFLAGTVQTVKAYSKWLLLQVLLNGLTPGL